MVVGVFTFPDHTNLVTNIVFWSRPLDAVVVLALRKQTYCTCYACRTWHCKEFQGLKVRLPGAAIHYEMKYDFGVVTREVCEACEVFMQAVSNSTI